MLKVRNLWIPACLVSAFLMVSSGRSAEPSSEAIAYFEKEVRPLLIEHCQKCHGDKKQESSLRVDSRAALLMGGDSGPSIVPGKAKEGTFLAAIRHTGDLHMPPAGKLPDRAIAILEKWIADGAAWPAEKGTTTTRTSGITEADRRHWAFQPVRMPTVPSVKDTSWAKNDLDRFTLATLESKGLKPVGIADKRTLIRRVTFDLAGLPPTPEEIADFLKDDSPAAFSKVVERLLASKQYGERWGRHWLDVARYADTAGDGSDYPVREAYKYRDWVIDAFNRDMPYDQFLREQIAGDILARKAPADQYASKVTATGFLAVGKRYGYNPGPDYQHLDFADVIESVGRSLMGLSLGCARCHDHKYEPISAADYYALYGIMQSTTWAFPGGEEQKRPTQFPPLVPPEEAARLDRAKTAELTRLTDQLVKLKQDRARLDGKFWAGGIDLALEGQPLDKPPGGVWLSSGPNRVLASAQSPFAHIHPQGNRGVRLGSATSGDGIRYVFQNALKATPGKLIHFSIDFRAIAETTTLGSHRFYLGRGVIASQALECSLTKTEFAIHNGTKWEVVRKLVPGEWYTLRITIDPEKKAYSGIVGKPGDLTPFEGKGLTAGWDGVLDTFICDGNGHSISKAAEHDLDNLALQETPFGLPGTKVAPPALPPADLKDRLAKLDAEIKAVEGARSTLEMKEAYPVAYGVSEGKPSNAKIQKRGEPDKLGAEIPRRFLEILGGQAVGKESASGRLDLAEWIVRPSNPLTARVFVNRIWGWHFGRGLVPTPSDFGTRGELPTHPELLDWLASYFVQSGWSVKAMHRLMVHSRTYQLSSADEASNMKSDPGNQYLWRHSRRALDAESIRDAMLAVSGKLDRVVPGQHPFPPVDSWGFTIHAPFHAVYDSNHRSVYLMLQRNRRHPFLALFDAADPNLSTAERLPTITPTQSLYLMNSPFVHEQANLLGKSLLAHPGDDAARIRHAFELANGHSPTAREVEESLAFVKAYAQKLTKRQAKDPVPTAWAALGRVLLTDNAFLYVD